MMMAFAPFIEPWNLDKLFLVGSIFITENVMPKPYDNVKAAVTKKLNGVSHISFMTDIWSTYLNSCSLMSPTALWLSTHLERKSSILHAYGLHIYFGGSWSRKWHFEHEQVST